MLKFLLFSGLATLVLTQDQVLQPRYLKHVPNTRVVGGEEARPHSWPWQVSLQVQSRRAFFHKCGGSLIKTGWVMTAAHCVDRPRTRRVVLGAHNLLSNEETQQIVSVSRAIIHPQWDGKASKGFDIALLQLSTEATLNSAVQLAVLPPSGQILPNNNPCFITGWGRTSTGGSLSDVLKQASLPIVDFQTCSSRDWWGSVVKPTMVCAGRGSNSGCQGDSGGPLNCQSGERFSVHGITSFVYESECLRRPTVFTRVSAYIDWINQITG
ncbi:hypothetical protein DPEC_G00193980 [Dallia pectoralis]|uniref:Uncharacterized protein n=1 Tax=Dallia pectoralis TaxID=75939 RepID=A0ACC2G742_DALPE|nr:hypothetical protein DPEC_G00193980 [Dallia pectoralis]